MKSLLKLMKRKERRWAEESKKETAKSLPERSISFRRRSHRQRKEHRQQLLDHTNCTLDESSSSSISDLQVAPWRADNFLAAGPPSDSDWWEEISVDLEGEDEDEVASAPVDSFDSVEDFLNSRVILRQKQQAGKFICKRFRNVGLETWLQVQEAWRVPSSPSSAETASSSYASSTSSSFHGSTSSVRPPSKAARRDIRKGVSNNRSYDLKKRVGLGDMIAIYNEMWNEDGSD